MAYICLHQQTALKKAFVILLLFSFLLQIIGYHLVFKYRQADIRKEAKRNLRRKVDPSLTEQFSFPLESTTGEEMPVWVDKHEFTYRGEMYDVIEKKVDGGRLLIRCLNDKKEKELIGHYKDLVKRELDQRSRKKASFLLKLISSGVMAGPVMPVAPAITSTLLQSDMRRQALLHISSEVLTPPPQAA